LKQFICLKFYAYLKETSDILWHSSTWYKSHGWAKIS
jgi:hypothetical protein